MGARRVGETTGQNGEGGEVVGPILTPSGLARYFVPASIIRSEGPTQAVYPAEFQWTGDMNATAELETWIVDLLDSGALATRRASLERDPKKDHEHPVSDPR
jgi:hypothetical protein